MANDRQELEDLRRLHELETRAAAPSKPQADPIQYKGAADVTPSGLGRSFTDALPVAGGVAGGAVGSLAGPLTGVGGAGLGYAAGSQLRDLIKQYILGDPMEAKGLSGAASDTVGNIATGAGLELGGVAAGKALSAAAPVLQQGMEHAPKFVRDIALDAIPFGNTAKKVMDAVMKSREGLPTAAKSVVDETAPLSEAAPFMNKQPSVMGNPELTPLPSKPPLTGDQIFKIRKSASDIGNTNGEGVVHQTPFSSPGDPNSRKSAIDHFLKNG